jgi:hypothetical protein
MRRYFGFFLCLVVAVAGICYLAAVEHPGPVSFEGWAPPAYPAEHAHWTKDEPNPPDLTEAQLLEADDFAFAMGVGSGWHGLSVFRMNAAGTASYVFPTDNGTRTGQWWRAEFQLAPEEVVRLRRFLQEVNYLSLKRYYHANVMDGTQWCIRVDSAGVTRKVYCNNSFPDAAVRLAEFIGQEVLPAHKASIQKARRISEEVSRRSAKDLW